MDTLLDIVGITKSYGSNRVLDGVDLSVGRGEVVGIVGENGAGKSTLMSVFSGLLQADGGTMRLNNAPYWPKDATDAQSRGVGIIQQDFSLDPTLTVARAIFRNTYQADRPQRALIRPAQWLLDDAAVGLDPDTPLGELAHAEQGLVEAVRLLAEDAQLVIMDEVAATLNVKEIDQLHFIISRLTRQGRSVLYVSHRLHEVQAVASRIAVVRNGRVPEVLDPRQVSAEDIAAHMRTRAARRAWFPDRLDEEFAVEEAETETASPTRALPPLTDPSPTDLPHAEPTHTGSTHTESTHSGPTHTESARGFTPGHTFSPTYTPSSTSYAPSPAPVAPSQPAASQPVAASTTMWATPSAPTTTWTKAAPARIDAPAAETTPAWFTEPASTATPTSPSPAAPAAPVGGGRRAIASDDGRTYADESVDESQQVVLEVAGLDAPGTSGHPVHDISFSVFSGEVLGITGPRRAGQDAIVGALNGRAPGTFRTLRINGYNRSISSAEDAALLKIAYLAGPDEETGEERKRSVARAMMTGGWADGSSFESEVDGIATILGALEKLHSATKRLRGRRALRHGVKPEEAGSTLSGGQQQMVLLDELMTQDADVLIVNEPGRGLDFDARAVLRGKLSDAAENGAAVLLISTDVDELARSCRRVLVLDEGRIARTIEGSPLSAADLTAALAQLG
ncbi:ATP-binding cassette domain-containing protein [Raineyella sp. LH-20]|uniref:ATP-binding cassette domain-containing protein n=1 Tax=Raineyella sp. LH-20 TaxID=3081204 RepID=UPI002955AF83|nr:ATP-binding cassette domain-containing protein [Raineyella sp. LH-20]WOP17573.1 ATP-binding cassette domain-containing protein [Raineyella sp. LH-20]